MQLNRLDSPGNTINANRLSSAASKSEAIGDVGNDNSRRHLLLKREEARNGDDQVVMVVDNYDEGSGGDGFQYTTTGGEASVPLYASGAADGGEGNRDHDGDGNGAIGAERTTADVERNRDDDCEGDRADDGDGVDGDHKHLGGHVSKKVKTNDIVDEILPTPIKRRSNKRRRKTTHA